MIGGRRVGRIWAPCLLAALLVSWNGPADPPSAVRVSVAKCVRLALANSLEAQMIRIQPELQKAREGLPRGAFDSRFNLAFTHLDADESQANPVFGSSVKDSQMNLQLDKRFSTGGTGRIYMANQRFDSDTPFLLINPSYKVKLSLSYTQPVLKNRWGVLDRGSVTLAELETQLADLFSLSRLEDLAFEVIQKYWELFQARRESEIRERSRDAIKRLHSHFARRAALGAVEDSDVLAVAAALSIREAELLEATNRVQDGVAALKLFLDSRGEYEGVTFLPADSPREHAPPVRLADAVEASIQTALANRSDYQHARRDLEQKELRARLAVNASHPSLDVSGGMAVTGLDEDVNESLSTAFEARRVSWSAGLNLLYTFGGQGEKAGILVSQIEQRAAQTRLRQIESHIRLEIDRAVRELAVGALQIQASRKALGLHREKMDKEMAKLRNGRSDSRTILEFQDDLDREEIRLLRITASHQIASAGLARAEGRLLSMLQESK